MTQELLRSSIYDCILDLSTEAGINASGKEDVYGCIFGRDSAISILKILKASQQSATKAYFDTQQLFSICRRGLLTLANLQGKETNLESGEEPGKCIHEYRPDNYERLTTLSSPWYIYPDGQLRNYDSIDSTPLFLIAMYRYWQYTQDAAFLISVLPAVEAGLNWIITYGDKDKDYLLEYELPKHRKHGGLPVQSWTDSHESMLDEKGNFPLYPIAPVEVQGYAWLALTLWANFYADTTTQFARTDEFAKKLSTHAAELKKRFNEIFFFNSEGYFYPAQALDGLKNQLQTVTGNPLLLLWATNHQDGTPECIVDTAVVPHIVHRVMMPDMFDPDAGIRTMSALSKTFNPGQDSYHNGSFWPKLNGMSHEGLENWGFIQEADALKAATLKPIHYFGSPIELYIKADNGEYLLYKNPQGQESCRRQAWSAAVALDLLTL